jgi:hypothetical protein
MKKTFYIFLVLAITSCGISEDCFKGNGNSVTQVFPLEGFTKVKVYDGVGLVIKEGPNYEVKIVTNDKVLDNIDVTMQGDMLVVKDNSSCNIARGYGQTVVYVTVPDGSVLPLIQELELHCKTEQKTQSVGILHSPIVRLFSIEDDGDGSGTGDFYLELDSSNVYVESNNVSNFYISGRTINLNVFFSWGNGKFKGENFIVTNILNVIHRGSNDMTIFPFYNLSGAIYATGNVILKNNPSNSNTLQAFFTGQIINDFN